MPDGQALGRGLHLICELFRVLELSFGVGEGRTAFGQAVMSGGDGHEIVKAVRAISSADVAQEELLDALKARKVV